MVEGGKRVGGWQGRQNSEGKAPGNQVMLNHNGSVVKNVRLEIIGSSISCLDLFAVLVLCFLVVVQDSFHPFAPKPVHFNLNSNGYRPNQQKRRMPPTHDEYYNNPNRASFSLISFPSPSPLPLHVTHTPKVDPTSKAKFQRAHTILLQTFDAILHVSELCDHAEKVRGVSTPFLTWWNKEAEAQKKRTADFETAVKRFKVLEGLKGRDKKRFGGQWVGQYDIVAEAMDCCALLLPRFLFCSYLGFGFGFGFGGGFFSMQAVLPL